MKPHLWIAYDFTSTSECLSMLDTILKQHPNRNIIHEISRPTLLQAASEGVPIISEFRQRLDNAQTIVADFKGYDVPYRAEGRFYYASLTDLVTVMATAPNEVIQDAIQEANTDQKLVAFDILSKIRYLRSRLVVRLLAAKSPMSRSHSSLQKLTTWFLGRR